ncbi:MAG: cadherin-like domain-containing protein [Chthonomonas sp.]|nr:cadherin-like domain-containing protein [Chthonomonas sp.]
MNQQFLFPMCLVALASIASAQEGKGWRDTQLNLPPANASETISRLSSYRLVTADLKSLRDSVAGAAFDRGGHTTGKPKAISVPRADGTTSTFLVTEYNLLSDELRQQHPTYKFYYGYNPANPVETVRLGFTDIGFHSTIDAVNGDEFIDPVAWGNTSDYYVYNRKNLRRGTNSLICGVTDEIDLSENDPFAPNPATGTIHFDAVGSNLKTYRLALNGTIEYTAARGGTVASAQSSMTVSMNRVNGIYEKDFGIRMSLNLLNPFIGSDPFTNTNGSTMLGQNQTQCDTNPGTANYDIGHVFSTGGGGVAGLGVVGVAGNKARGVTGGPSPTGDAFDIDYVAHEMGHQFGGAHTFNGSVGSCAGGNRSASSAYEPGSGSTIMAYAGICGTDDLQTNSDAYFHTRSVDQIVAWRNNAGSGGSAAANGNAAPVVNAGADYTIPLGTPFRLTGSATDANGDALTYCWEQYNLGSTTAATNTSTGVLFRSFNPSTNPYRTFPNLTAILNNSATPWEVLPTVARTMIFRCLVRDNRAGGGENNQDSTTITATGTAFSVTSQNTATTWNAGTPQTITWNVGGGSVASNVRIVFSRTSGTNFDSGTGVETIIASTPNDGSETINAPWGATTTGRFSVEAVGNIFFDVNNAALTINESNSVAITAAPATILAGASGTGTVNLSGPAPTGGLTFNLSDNNANVTVPATVVFAAGETSKNFAITTTGPATGGTVTLTLTRTGQSYSKTTTFALRTNGTPVGNNDAYTLPSAATYNSAISVLANDTDPDSDPLQATLVSTTPNGTLSLGTNGQFTYTPNGGFSGVDSFTYRATDTALNSGITTVNLTVPASDQVLTGNITLDQFSVSPAGQLITIEVYAVGGNTVLRSGSAVLDGSGNYSFTLGSPLAAGNYDVRVKGSHWLAKRLTNRAFSATAASGLNGTLTNGDVNGDNIVDIADYSLLAAAFDLATSGPEDLNGDGLVDIADYTILATSFDLSGDN